ncbi:universal stress protein [Amycolatopsis sp. cmx-8-4]|uniref:universal stress protein n=1 Tax=Amycolatopsis sp. cmx-8-4 TaxID=2790947 RepID=UPI00397A5FA9
MVVRGDRWDEPGTGGPVVTGIDGGDAGTAVLATALAEARARQVPLVVLHAWADEPPAEPAPEAVVEAGRRLLAEQVRPGDVEDVRVERVVVPAHPRRELVERSRSAQLIVLGDRGRGGFPGLLLGSTAQALLHHAGCPVRVVRTARPPVRP